MTARSVLQPVLALLALLAVSWGAHAQAFRTYLSSTGVDNATCSRPSPCRLLPAALAAVADGGEVWVLDSANYNTAPVNVTKSVTILAVPGAVGSIVATSGPAMWVYTPGIEVTLRNLVFVPLPGTGATTGLIMGMGATLTVEGCAFANLPQSALHAGNGTLRVIDSSFRDTGASGLYLEGGVRAEVTGSTVSGNQGAGITVMGFNGGGTTRAEITDTMVDNNAAGIYVLSLGSNPAAATVHDSRIVGNRGTALWAQSDAGSPAVITASSNLISNNEGPALYSSTTASRILSSGNAVSGNAAGSWNAPGAVFETTSDNAVRNNVSASTGTITPVPMR